MEGQACLVNFLFRVEQVFLQADVVVQVVEHKMDDMRLYITVMLVDKKVEAMVRMDMKAIHIKLVMMEIYHIQADFQHHLFVELVKV